MEKQVFLAIFVFALVKFQGINGSAITTTTPIPGCSCDTMLDPNVLPPRQFGKKNHINCICHFTRSLNLIT